MTDLLTFARQLRGAYCRETSELPHLWTPDLPSTGQCHVSALLIQRTFGGVVMEGDFDGVGHFWNNLDGIHFDATRDQFPTVGTLRTVRFSLRPPLQVTLDKAALLAELAWKAAA